MAIRDRYRIRLRNGQGEETIEVTRQGGEVVHLEPRGTGSMHVFEETSGNISVRTLSVHKDEILAIIRDEAPKTQTRVRVRKT